MRDDAERLADHFQNTQLVWIDNSRTLIPIDQTNSLTNLLHTSPPCTPDDAAA